MKTKAPAFSWIFQHSLYKLSAYDKKASPSEKHGCSLCSFPHNYPTTSLLGGTFSFKSDLTVNAQLTMPSKGLLKLYYQ